MRIEGPPVLLMTEDGRFLLSIPYTDETSETGHVLKDVVVDVTKAVTDLKREAEEELSLANATILELREVLTRKERMLDRFLRRPNERF